MKRKPSELENLALGAFEIPLKELELELNSLEEDCHIDGVILLETGGCLLVQDDGLHLHGLGMNFEQTILRTVFEVRSRKLPLKCLFMTHHDPGDKTCVDAFEILRSTKPKWFNFKILGHAKNEELYSDSLYLSLTQDEEFIKLDGRQYFLVSTPGHSKRSDHIAILEMSKKILFVGTLLQPQGESYEYCTFLTPVSSHHHPIKVNLALENLKTLPFEWGVSQNGELLNRSRTYRWIETTQKTFERTAYYARKVLWEEDIDDIERAAKRVYELMCMERNLSLDTVAPRFEKINEQPTEFEQFDLPSIYYFLKKFGWEE